MSRTKQENNKALVLEAFDTLFNKRDYPAAERYWSPHYIQHSAQRTSWASAHFAVAQSFLALFFIAVAAYSKLCSGDDVGPYSSVKTVDAKIFAVYGEDFSDALTLSNPNKCRISKVHRTVGVLAHQLAHSRNVS